jgi:hypothetical protein
MGDFMTTIRKFVCAALLAVTALNIAPNLAAAEQPAHGKFTLKHDVLWGSAKVPAGDYEFSYDPLALSPVLTITRVSGARASYMVLIPASGVSKASDANQLLLETSADGSYVSAMCLPQSGVTLYFTVPSRTTKQLTKSATTIAAAGQ